MKNIKKDLMFYHIKTKSFTLIELLVVIVIIGILAGVITLSVSSNISKAQDLKISSTILSVSKTLKSDSYDSFPIETVACNLKNSCTTLKARIDLPNITEDIYYKTSSSGKFFVIYANKPSNTSLGYEITSIDEKVKEVPSFDNLVAYYPLATGTANGTAISDMSPNSNNGTNYGASSATGVDGNIGTVMSFDGVDDYVEVADSSSISPTDQISVSAWVKFNVVGENIGIVWKNNYNYLLYCEVSGVNFLIYDTLGKSSIASVTYGLISPGEWYHIVGTFGSDHKARIYLNNVLYSTGSEITNIRDREGSLIFGARGDSAGERYLNGSIDDVRIYNRVLSQSEVTLLYNNK